MKRMMILAVVAVALAGSVFAEEGVMSKADLAQLAMQASGLSENALVQKIAEYKELIAEKTAQITGLKEQLKGFSWKDMLGSEAKAVKSDLDEKTATLSSLNDQLAVYTKALAALQAQ